MVRRILLGLVVVAVIVLIYMGYNNYRQKHAMLSGDVTGGPSETLDSVTSAILPKSSPPLPAQTSGQSTGQTSSQPTGTLSKMLNGPAPATDSMPANPPNGMAYAGSGHFQVYRQGNLTYRLNTDTGQSCILYATEEEWRKPRVYEHGCGNSAAQ